MLADIAGPDIIILLLVVVIVLFGGAAIPKLARNLGTAKSEFEKGIKEGAKSATSTPSETSGTEKATTSDANPTDLGAPSSSLDSPKEPE